MGALVDNHARAPARPDPDRIRRSSTYLDGPAGPGGWCSAREPPGVEALVTVTLDLLSLVAIVLVSAAVPVTAIYALGVLRVERRVAKLREDLDGWHRDLDGRVTLIEDWIGELVGVPGAPDEPDEPKPGTEVVDSDGERVGWVDTASAQPGRTGVRIAIDPWIRPFLDLHQRKVQVPDEWIGEAGADRVALSLSVLELRDAIRDASSSEGPRG